MADHDMRSVASDDSFAQDIIQLQATPGHDSPQRETSWAIGSLPSNQENADVNPDPSVPSSQNEVQPSPIPNSRRRQRDPTPDEEDRANDSDDLDSSQAHPASRMQVNPQESDDEDSELDKIKAFWQTIPESLRTIDMASYDPLPSDCLEPSAEHLLMMCAHSKTMALLAPNDKRRLMQPYQGVPCVFVEEASDVLGPHILNVLHFFNLLNNTGLNYASFCVGTSEVSLDFDHESPDKVVRGFVYEGVYGSRGRHQRSARNTPFLVRNILKKRRDHESGVLRIPLTPIDIKIGWIGAEGTVGGEKRRKMYCCLIVTPVAGFNMWEYIHRVFCAMPEKNAKNYAEELANYKQRCLDFRRIYDHEAFVNLGMDPNEHTDIETKFRYSPGSEGGYFTMLNMFMLPFKIYNLFMTEFPQATNLLIMKCPTFRFNSDSRTEAWNAYLQAYINEAAAFQAIMDAGIKQFWATKPKERHALDNLQQTFLGGWPLKWDQSGEILGFGLPPLPLLCQFKMRTEVCPHKETFLANIGSSDALPELVQQLYRAFVNKASPLNEYPSIQPFLTQTERFTPKLWHQRFFSSESNLIKGLIADGRMASSKLALIRDIQDRRSKGTTVAAAARIWRDYVEGMHSTLRSMLGNGVFHSETLKHAGDVLGMVDWTQACSDDEFSLRKTLAKLSVKNPNARKHDRLLVTHKAFMCMWEELNKHLHMNSANTTYALELLISTLMLKFGDNSTWDKFCIMIIVMSGYGHFQVNTPAGPGADNRKPNSTGMDFVIKCVSLIVKCLYMHVGVVDKRKHYESPAVVSRWTPTALEMMGYATVVGNEIKSVPPTSMRDRPVVAPEMRGFIHGALVNALPRGPNSDQTLSSSSCQTTANSGIYTAATKEEVCKPSFCAITSNQLNNTPETFEYTTSLMAVAKVLTPGAPPPDDAAIPEDEDMRKLLVKVNANLKRTEKITEPRVPAYFLVFPHFFVGVHAGLLNRVGAIDYDIPPALLGYLEWLHIIVKNFFGMMDVKVVESYHRLAQGHMSRVVGFAAWIEGIRRMAEGKDAVQTSTNLALSLQFNALPLPMIPYILDTFLPRCIHTSSLVVSSMLIELLHVPVIEREELEHFFNTPQPPSQAEVVHYDTFNKIRVFITECIRKQRFCPDNDEAPFDSSSNTSPYITGDVVGERNDTWLLLMRDWKRAVDDAEAVLKKVGNALRDKYGDEAYLQVHMNREACIWVNALRNCRDKYKPCSTVFCGQSVYKSRQHFIKLGLHTHMPGMQNAVPREKMPYLRTVVLHGGQGGDKAGIAVNVWDLLVQASVMRGARLGVHMNNEVASSIIRFALDMAPVSCTPGNALIRSTFNMVSGKNEELLLKRDRNIHHFLRGDLHDFATTGRLSILPVLPDTNFLPEDYLHMASIKPLADFYKCKTIYEVPASAIKFSYCIMPLRYYSYHVPGERRNGVLIVDSPNEVVKYWDFVYDEDTMENDLQGQCACGLDDWEEMLCMKGAVLTPMIWRSGACVQVRVGARVVVGVLITPSGCDTQFDHTTASYEVLVRPPPSGSEGEESDHPSQPQTTPSSPRRSPTLRIHFMSVLENLIAPGEILYLRHGGLANPEFKKPGKYLQVRLNVPNTLSPEAGRVYVTCHYYARTFGRPETIHLPSITMNVAPWDLILPASFRGRPEDVLEYLQPLPSPI